MISPFDRGGQIAFGLRGDRDAADLWSAASRLTRVLPPRSEGGSALLVFESDRFLFAAALLAVWARGMTALVPPDNRRATLTRMQRLPEVRVILHDTESGLDHRVQEVLREPDSVPDLDLFLETLDDRWRQREGSPLLTLHGGVAAGTPFRVDLDGPALAAELARLDAALPTPAAARVVSSVPIGHRYGFVHGVLRPLAAGGAFYRGMGPASALAEALDDLAADVLVTHPHELERLAVGPRVPLRLVLSSGEALAPGASARTEATFGVEPADLFTLSALGAIGWRHRPDEPWSLLPGVEAGPLDEGAWFSVDGTTVGTADRLERAPGGGFLTRGRRDRRARFGAREVELDEVVDLARSVDGVSDAGALAVADALLVAVASARADLVAAEVGAAVRTGLGAGSELPVDARAAPSLPRDGLGRLPAPALLALFGRGPDGSRRVETLTPSAPVALEGGGARFAIDVPADYRWFDGHFDQYPILPAAVQLEALVVPCARRAGLLQGPVRRFERLKFSRRIEPGTTVEVSVAPAARGGIRFDIEGPEGILTSGRLVPAEEST